MKKIKLLLLLLVLGTAQAYSQLQQIKIVSFTVKNQLPAAIDTWGSIPASLLLVAQLPPNVSVKGIRLMVQIKSNGAIFCGNNSAGGMQVDEFTTRTFSANELTSTLQNCNTLKDGSYSICVQFYNVDRVAISNEVCKEFTVETPRETEYTPPTLINPENGKVFTEAELSRPVTFRWTPLVPKPREPVTYRLKVWQLMQGQTAAQAMHTNQPIVTKDVDNITQAVVNGIYNGPCKPPYLCDFVWQVQSLNREGKPMGKNEGNSAPYTFKVETNTTTYASPQLVSPTDGKAFATNEMSAPVVFRWTPVVPKPQSVIYRLKVWQLMQGQNGTQAMRTNQPIVTKDVDNITQAVVTGIYTGPCKPPYLCDFVWQVQAVDREDHPIGANEGRSELWAFKVGDNGVTTCTAPKLSAPADAKSFSPKEMGAPVLFRWTPIVPKPQEPVTYRLKVWQLMQGQSGTQAMRENKPIVVKDVDNTTEASINNIYTGPCKPPYLCDFIWEVQALTREGKPACSTNEGKSEAWSFKIQNNIDIQIDSLKVNCCEKGVQSIYIKVKNNLATPVKVVAVKYKVNGAGAAINLSPISPIPPQTIVGNGFVVFTGSVPCDPAISFLKFLVDAEDVADPDNKETEVKSDTLHCRCTACDEKNFTFKANPPNPITIINNTISFNQPITITTTPPKTIKTIKAELVYYEMVPENDMCIPCNKDAATYGHFTNGTNSQEWNGPQQNLNINITTPQLTPCCSAVFKWCIRYKIEFTDCTTCNKLVCYEKKKDGCEKVNHDNNQK